MALIDSLVADRFVHTTAGPVPIYIHPDPPLWLVPTPSAHRLLEAQAEETPTGSSLADALAQTWHSIGQGPLLQSLLEVQSFLSGLVLPSGPPYRGRAGRSVDRLEELWFHVTDACNMRCRHCLFGRTLNPNRALSAQVIKRTIEEAEALGCRLVCFTGGEPLMHPEFIDILEEILRHTSMRVAILTNGLLVPHFIKALAKMDRDRIHLQVSVDGDRRTHEALRGRGTFDKALAAIKALVRHGVPCSIAMAINKENHRSLVPTVELTAALGVGTLHLQWHFSRGRGSELKALPESDLVCSLVQGAQSAERHGVCIDNVDAIRAQVFAAPGTRFDLGNACWQSLAVGPDGLVYPTPAMVDRPALAAGALTDGLETIWTESPLFKKIRTLSLMDCADMRNDPWRFVIGGGDIDHCLAVDEGNHTLSLGPDPYAGVYRAIAAFVIEQEARNMPVAPHPGVVLKMGDIASACPSPHEVNFVHCNCLLSFGNADTRSLVRAFYGDKAQHTDAIILNPVSCEDPVMAFIPKKARLRRYGCGSPVDEASVKAGEVVVDLGSGTGVECFVAARASGPDGLVVGVDMTDSMLAVGQEAAGEVARALGFNAAAFVKGYLEDIPLADASADVVISNCVINLSRNKRRVFSEIRRILKPGGRLVISDVVTESEPSPVIRANHRLMGECIAGAMVESYLFALLRDMGFAHSAVLKRFPYRVVSGHRFYALTFTAFKPPEDRKVQRSQELFYTGPFLGICTEQGVLIRKAQRTCIAVPEHISAKRLAENRLFTLDPETGAVSNAALNATCCCPEAPEAKKGPSRSAKILRAHETGCLICGAPIVYPPVPNDQRCSRCGKIAKAEALCADGHFVCDLCHIRDPLEVVRQMCTQALETDMIQLMARIRSHAAMPMHGPEHHALVPGVILRTYQNLGGNISRERVLTGIERGSRVPGGACAFMGTCGAAVGVGIAFSIILEATPLTPKPRKTVQQVVGGLLQEVGRLKAARCCQRESYLCLKAAAAASKELLSETLRAETELSCTQYEKNKECIRRACILYPKQAAAATHERPRIHRLPSLP